MNETQQQCSPPPSVHHLTPPVCLCVSLQDRLTVEAPKRHKVSVHVLSREMDSCEYLYSRVSFMCFIWTPSDVQVNLTPNENPLCVFNRSNSGRVPRSE